ncbi:GrpB family protein [Rathayibacter sp. VKM Ac-2857]|uniref:GrpB family protein n=1 Tax=Rathayibacter sp. VKM Ac-2857 TaxID=2739020 RepID=UPI0015678041|nr:GrpB family protein [Rathayibacter sp. VKM Ac-2857]
MSHPPPAADHPRAVHIHVYATGSPQKAQQLRFRNPLRRDPGPAAEYAELKHRLARRSDRTKAPTTDVRQPSYDASSTIEPSARSAPAFRGH